MVVTLYIVASICIFLLTWPLLKQTRHLPFLRSTCLLASVCTTVLHECDGCFCLSRQLLSLQRQEQKVSAETHKDFNLLADQTPWSCLLFSWQRRLFFLFGAFLVCVMQSQNCLRRMLFYELTCSRLSRASIWFAIISCLLQNLQSYCLTVICWRECQTINGF